jgi:hypothetical protein
LRISKVNGFLCKGGASAVSDDCAAEDSAVFQIVDRFIDLIQSGTEHAPASFFNQKDRRDEPRKLPARRDGDIIKMPAIVFFVVTLFLSNYRTVCMRSPRVGKGTSHIV